jgi:hypothetical protein
MKLAAVCAIVSAAPGVFGAPVRRADESFSLLSVGVCDEHCILRHFFSNDATVAIQFAGGSEKCFI